MNIPDLTPEQDAAFALLRKWHNRDNPANQMTKGQLVGAYALQCFENAVREANDRVTGAELRNAYNAAPPSVRAQVDTVLGL